MKTVPLRLLALVAACLASLASSSGVWPAHGQAVRRHAVASPELNYIHLFGGANGEENAHLALGERSNVFLAGTTSSRNWPVAWRAKCAQQICTHAFLLKLSPDGTHVFYRLELGGSRDTSVSGIAVDAAGDAYLTGITTSPNFPTVYPFQRRCGGSAGATCNDGFVAKINP